MLINIFSTILCMGLNILITSAEASVALLGAVLRSVEALLCRLTGEAWQNQELPAPPYCHTGAHDARECEPQAGYTQPGDTNMCYTQVRLCFVCSISRNIKVDHNINDHITSTVFFNEYDQSRAR